MPRMNPINLRALREAAGLSQEQLAEASEISRETISRIENGAISPTVDTLTALAAALNVPTAALLPR